MYPPDLGVFWIIQKQGSNGWIDVGQLATSEAEAIRTLQNWTPYAVSCGVPREDTRIVKITIEQVGTGTELAP